MCSGASRPTRDTPRYRRSPSTYAPVSFLDFWRSKAIAVVEKNRWVNITAEHEHFGSSPDRSEPRTLGSGSLERRRFPTISDGIIHPADGTVGITSPGNYAIPSPERNSVEQWRRPQCRDASPLICHRIVGTAPCLPGLSCPAPDDEFRARPNRGPELRAWTSTVAHRAPARSLEVENCAGRGRRAAVSLDATPNYQLGPSPPQTGENPVRCAVHWDPRPPPRFHVQHGAVRQEIILANTAPNQHVVRRHPQNLMVAPGRRRVRLNQTSPRILDGIVDVPGVERRWKPRTRIPRAPTTPDQELVSGPDTAGHAARCRPFVPHRHPLICSGIEPRPFRTSEVTVVPSPYEHFGLGPNDGHFAAPGLQADRNAPPLSHRVGRLLACSNWQPTGFASAAQQPKRQP
jgi:hypothetical protein